MFTARYIVSMQILFRLNSFLKEMMVSDSKYQGRTTFNIMIVVPSWTKILHHFQKL